MGFFGKLFKKKDDFDLGAPPDFSQPVGQGAQQDQYNPYGKDPLQSGTPFDSFQQGGDPNATGAPGSNFEHDIFSSEQPTNADRARAFAQTLGNPQGAQPGSPGGPGSVTYAGAVSGHEAQLILERLDTIKAELDAIKQRLMHVERYMESAEQKTGQRKYF